MNFQQLEYLIALQRERNFAQAAESCHVTQPTLSMQLKKLEEEWGILLFERGNGPLSATPMGEIVLKHAQRVLAEREALLEVVRNAREKLDGTLILGVIPTVSPYLLPRFVLEFTRQHPGLTLVLRDLQSEEIMEGLKTGEIDAGLLALPALDEELEELPLFREPLWLCISANLDRQGLELDPEELLPSKGPLVLTGGHCLREQVLQYCGTSRPSDAEVLYEGGSLETLVQLVAKGEGYTLLPELAIPAQVPEGARIRPFPEPAPEREIGLLVHKRFVRRKLIENLGRSIRENVPEEMLHRKGKRLLWRK